MSTKLGDIIKRQLTKLNIEITDELKPLTELDNVIPDDISSKFDKGLMTIEAAKTNPEILKTIKASTLNGIDAKIDEIIKEYGVNVSEEFAKEQNSYEKVSILAKYLLEQGKRKAEQQSKDGASETIKNERKQFADKEAELQRKINELSNAVTQKETEFKSIRENDLLNFELQKYLLSKNSEYVFPDEMDSSLKVATALGAINKELSKQNFRATLTDGGLKIVDENNNPAYGQDGIKIDNASKFIDGVLAQNKLLKINDANNSQNNQHQNNGANRVIETANGVKGNPNIVAEIEAQMELFK